MKRLFISAAAAVMTLMIFLTGCADKKLYTLREEAVKAYEAGDYETARELFDGALSYGNGQVADVELDILRYRAECELRLKDYEAAKESYRILSGLDDSEDGKLLYGELEEQFERVSLLTEAVKLMEEGSYEKAYASFDQLAGLGGDALSAAAWFNKAVCAEYMGAWPEAAELFGDYLAIYPEDADAEKEYDFCITR